ncbi:MULTISPECIES: MAPEG family protein [Vibrio]|uniref:Glutathione S-transferase n=3 Tax=Vibrio cyclitrophicus TaxID=47951 RepID=A0A7Z1MF27_9VIBR|nr:MULTISPECIES: MAPEG family protein [Vibrio]KNH15113.1 membrane protein [Vibrio lentus]MBY7659260.1 MAPEG family protein [Vibrio atlanticus]ERM58511.1 putative membrane protein [Vibrio cyclitrophicus FF75]KAA8602931.1 Inner membrane protein YecN [Vibrio cyclitrophicus]MBE8558438.1 MAPEG family protein [Vibrio sp. OPT24]|tara:strand:+ start:449 stop:835 length:387 start_codon:yes stop_codon:yes gene_type:complete
MVTALYAALLTVVMIWLAIEVIKQRRANLVAYADGGVESLQIARSAQSNAMDYIPITIILMGFLEMNGANVWFIHVLGVAFLLGRVIHAKGILAENFKGRKVGMVLTLICMISLIVLNLAYLPFDKMF